MLAFPSKLIDERVTFQVPFGDVLAWGDVITTATAVVTVVSGIDPSPQQVFWQIYSVDKQIVSIQFRRGKPGVIYNVALTVTVGSDTYTKNFSLAVLNDPGLLPGLFPLTRVLPSHPYNQLWKAAAKQMFSSTAAKLTVVVFSGILGSDLVDHSFVATGASLETWIPPYIRDSVTGAFVSTAASLHIPAHFWDIDSVNHSFVANDAQLFTAPRGFYNDLTTCGIIPTYVNLYWPDASKALLTSDSKWLLDESGKAIITG